MHPESRGRLMFLHLECLQDSRVCLALNRCAGSMLVILFCLSLPACTTLTIASMVATTVSNAVEREQATPRLDKSQIAAANIGLGVEYMRKAEYEKALEKLEAAREAEPRNAMAYSVMALVRQRMGEFAEAERLFKQSVKLNRADSDVLSNYGQFLCARGRSADAERFFLDAAQNPLYRTPEVPYANAGTCAYKNGRTEQAIEYFHKALQSQPALPNVLLQMAEISFDRGEYLPARDYLLGYLHTATHNQKSLWLGIRIEKELNNKDAVSSYALLLRNRFAGTAEAALLEESGIR